MKTKIFTLMILFCALQLTAQHQMDPKMIEMIKSKKSCLYYRSDWSYLQGRRKILAGLQPA